MYKGTKRKYTQINNITFVKRYNNHKPSIIEQFWHKEQIHTYRTMFI